jgi:hypothetical protein
MTQAVDFSPSSESLGRFSPTINLTLTQSQLFCEYYHYRREGKEKYLSIRSGLEKKAYRTANQQF